jgi:hypothetical protein
MSEPESGLPPRFGAARSLGSGTTPPRETAETVLPGIPRVGALDALLREIDGLRLTLETDLSLAASAVDAGAPQVAIDIIDSDRDGLRAFSSRALDHLADLADESDGADRAHGANRGRRRWWTRVPAAPFVAAAAVVGFLVGVVPHSSGGSTPSAISADPASANQSLQQLTRLAADGQTSEVRTAAAALHSQIMQLVEQAYTDPAAAQQGLRLLSIERAVIAESGDSQALRDVIAASTHLSNLIIASIRSKPATPTTVAMPTPVRPKPSSTPAAKATAKPAPKATPKASPSAKPQPSRSPSDEPTVLPTGPSVQP